MSSFVTLADWGGAWDTVFRRLWFGGPAEQPSARPTDDLFMFIFWFSVFWFVLLMGLMVYWCIRWRRRPGVPAPRSASHNTPLELAWTILPLIPLAGIFFKGFQTYLDKLVAPNDAIELNVQGWKWRWGVTYPNGAESPLELRPGDSKTTYYGDGVTGPGAVAIPVFVVPAGKPVKLIMSSRDVIHSFWIPSMRVKQDVVPNRYTSYWFKAEAPNPAKPAKNMEGIPDGTPYEDHWVFCAEYCGEQHSEMVAVIRVIPEDAYTVTLEKWLTPSGLPPEQLGLRIAKNQGCFSCHSIDGTKNTGPTWKEVYGYEKKFVGGTSMSEQDMTDPVKYLNYIRESILVPGAKVHEGYQNQMTPYTLSDEAIRNIAAYIRSLSPKNVPDAPATPAPEGGEKKN